MQVHAILRHLRMSPRKVRLVINTVRGMSATAADTRLAFLNRGAALPVRKLLQSAIANAEHNFHLNREDLVISKITADGGPTIKRFRPRARGSAAPIRKRTTHVAIVLSPRGETAAKVPEAPKAKVAAPKAAPKKKAPARKSAKPSAESSSAESAS